ncbi:hypothetical protein PoB_001173200 [Plakobranchus ocellatus]|uniref:Uncharacterized protein n=1 Tax=Plakobranchus ocellatus TaxID=259542 RepID=A0AAV3YRV2_9GAST|nr:hypothetical protein PoB_001173200 [Plakobranchus ocellatus]
MLLNTAALLTEDDLTSELRNWFDNLDVDFFRVGINSLLSRWQKCIDLHEDHVEKHLEENENFTKLFRCGSFRCISGKIKSYIADCTWKRKCYAWGTIIVNGGKRYRCVLYSNSVTLTMYATWKEVKDDSKIPYIGDKLTG